MSLEDAAEQSEASPAVEKQRPRKQLRGRFAPLLVPILDAFEMLGVSVTKGYEMVGDGIIETVMIDNRRHATQEGLERLAKSGALTPPEAKERHRKRAKARQRNRRAKTQGDKLGAAV